MASCSTYVRLGLAAASLLGLRPAAAQPAAIARYGPAQGLTMRTVLALAQDARGRLWVGTEYGLAAFDGERFRVFAPDPERPGALGGANAMALAPVSGGDGVYVWSDGGLQRYDPAADRFATLSTAPALLPGRDPAAALASGPSGGLWIASRTALYWWREGRAPRALAQTETPLLGLAPDGRGRVWAVTSRGLLHADTAQARRVEFPSALGRPSAVLVARDRRLVVGTDRGVYARPPAADGPWQTLAALPAVLALAEDPHGSVWAGTPETLVRIGPNGPERTPVGTATDALPGALVNHVFVDREGALWAVAGASLVSRPTRPPLFHVLPMAPHGDASWTLGFWAAPGGVHFRATANHGLLRCTDVACTPAPLPADVRRVYAVAALPRTDTLVLATASGGLLCLAPTRRRAAPCPGAPPLRAPRTLAAAPDGTLWTTAPPDGLARRTPDGRWQLLGLAGAPEGLRDGAFSLAPVDARGAWVGTLGGGLFWVDAAAARVRATHVALGGAPERLRVTALLRRGDTLYAATLERGVARLVTGARGTVASVRWIGTGEGLPSSVVHSLALDRSGHVWAFTDFGAARLRGRGRADAFVSTDGWPDASPLWNAAHTAPDGRIRVGTTRGVVVFDPSQALAALRVPDLALSQVRVLGTLRHADASYAPPLRLRHDENALAVDLSPDTPGPVRPWTYAFRLVQDARPAPWQSLGRTASLDLVGLAPGGYRLDVRTESAGRTGRVRSLAFRVAPPWWGTPWARMAAALALAALLGAAYRARVAHLLALERTRRRIADDLHDDLGSKLAALAAQLDLAGQLDLTAPPPRNALPHDRYAAFAQHARGLVDDLRDAVWIIDARADRLDRLADKLEATAYAALPGGLVRVTRPDVLPPLPVAADVRRHVLLAMREMLHNAARHRGTAAVDVTLALDGGGTALVATVRDRGPGLPDTFRPEGRGLSTLRRRADALGGTFTLENADGGGAVATFAAPLGKRRRTRDG